MTEYRLVMALGLFEGGLVLQVGLLGWLLRFYWFTSFQIEKGMIETMPYLRKC